MSTTYNNAKRILTAKTPVSMKRTDREQAGYSQYVVYWVLTEREHADECVELLNNWTWPTNYTDDDSAKCKTVTDFVTQQGPHPGVWRYIHAENSEIEGEQRIILILEAELNTSAPITEADSKWRKFNGGNQRGSSNLLILQQPNCDPAYVEAMAEENTEAFYTNGIYTINAGLQSGTWYNIDTKWEINPETGYGMILWYLARHNNDDLFVTWMEDAHKRVVEIFKYQGTETSIDDLQKNYYVDSATGNVLYTEDDGTTYTKLNGTAVDPAVAMPETADNLKAVVSQRTTDIKTRRRDGQGEDRFYQLNAHIEFILAGTPHVLTLPNGDKIYHGVRTTALPTFGSNTQVLQRQLIEHPDNTYTYNFYERFAKDSSSGGTVAVSTTYGTPLVKITDSLITGATAMPGNVSGSVAYNTAGTSMIEVLVINPRFDEETLTFSYTLRTITRWAPCAIQSTGVVGYIEGPSKAVWDSELSWLAKGVYDVTCRRLLPALRSGDFTLIDCAHPAVIVYSRCSESMTVLVAANLSAAGASFRLDLSRWLGQRTRGCSGAVSSLKRGPTGLSTSRPTASVGG